jgi:hypothetical protein
LTQPTSVPADGYVAVLWVPSIPDPEFPLQSELNAGSVVDLSCYIVGGGFANSVDEAVINDTRLCSRQDFDRPGKFKQSLSLTYVFNPTSPSNDEARITLTYLTTGYIVVRYGVPFDDPWAVGDIVDIYPAQAGKPVKTPSEENSVLKIMQKIFITAAVAEDVVVLGS